MGGGPHLDLEMWETMNLNFAGGAPKVFRNLILSSTQGARVPHPFRSLIAEWVGNHKSQPAFF
jgi:hypothetical protein